MDGQCAGVTKTMGGTTKTMGSTMCPTGIDEENRIDKGVVFVKQSTIQKYGENKET